MVSGGYFLISENHQFSEAARHSVQARRRVPGDSKMEVFAVLCSLFTSETECETSVRSWGVTMYLAVHPRRIVLRVGVNDVFCQIRLKG